MSLALFLMVLYIVCALGVTMIMLWYPVRYFVREFLKELKA